jgi:hypothetical protein
MNLTTLVWTKTSKGFLGAEIPVVSMGFCRGIHVGFFSSKKNSIIVLDINHGGIIESDGLDGLYGDISRASVEDLNKSIEWGIKTKPSVSITTADNFLTKYNY